MAPRKAGSTVTGVGASGGSPPASSFAPPLPHPASKSPDAIRQAIAPARRYLSASLRMTKTLLLRFEDSPKPGGTVPMRLQRHCAPESPYFGHPPAPI